MILALRIAAAHLMARKRQSIISIMGVALGVGFFIAVSGMMAGFQQFLLRELIESYPHITITDEYRNNPVQPAELLAPVGAVHVARTEPRDPVRGLAGAPAMIQALDATAGIAVAPVLRGQLLLRQSGRDYAVTALGIEPEREVRVTRVAEYMIAGSISSLNAVPDGVVIGKVLAERMQVELGDTVVVASPAGVRTGLRIVGIFDSGMDSLDRGQVYVSLAKQQSLQARPRVINELRLRLQNVSQSIAMAASLEARFGYKAAPWEETNARFLQVFKVQNLTIYPTVGAILLVAGFGIFNIISTIVMEKSRDIAILRAVGLPRHVLLNVFLLQGLVVALLGTVLGWALAYGMAAFLSTVPAPGSTPTNPRNLSIATEAWRFGLAGGLAFIIAMLAAFLPARKAARTNPLEIIRGAA